MGNSAWYARIRVFRLPSSEFPLHGVLTRTPLGHAACWLSRRPPTYIQRRAIRYRPHTSAKATIAQSTATNQKGIAVRPLPLAWPSGSKDIDTQEGHVCNIGVSSLVNYRFGSYAPEFG